MMTTEERSEYVGMLRTFGAAYAHTPLWQSEADPDPSEVRDLARLLIELFGQAGARRLIRDVPLEQITDEERDQLRGKQGPVLLAIAAVGGDDEVRTILGFYRA